MIETWIDRLSYFSLKRMVERVEVNFHNPGTPPSKRKKKKEKVNFLGTLYMQINSCNFFVKHKVYTPISRWLKFHVKSYILSWTLYHFKIW